MELGAAADGDEMSIKEKLFCLKKLCEMGREPRIGLVFGSGGARGWAHVGVIKALSEYGIVPDIVVGTSSGAIAGAALVSGSVDALTALSERTNGDKTKFIPLFIDYGLPRSGGICSGEKVSSFLRTLIPDRDMSLFPIKFAAVATDIFGEGKVVLDSGSIIDALRASISIPGFFSPVRRGGTFLVDGGIADPVPVDVARDYGADFVLAVNINGLPNVSGSVHGASVDEDAGKARIGIFEVLSRSWKITEDIVSRNSLLAYPPDILIEPDVSKVGTLDFHVSTLAVKAGYDAAVTVLDAHSCEVSFLQRICGRRGRRL